MNFKTLLVQALVKCRVFAIILSLMLNYSSFMLKVQLYAEAIGKTSEQIEADIRWPKYFSPTEAVEYGIIDRVTPLQRE